MNNKNIKTHFDRNVFITFLVLLAIGFSLLSFKMNGEVDCTAVNFSIIASSRTTEDLIEFKSTDASGVDWSWDFGDGSIPVFRSNVVHQFKEPGTYKVVLKMNGQCMATRQLVISEPKILISPELVPTIDFPKKIRAGDEVVFSNSSPFARSWQWSFGETMRIDGTGKEEKYSFGSPGDKTILLVVNGDRRHEAKQRVTVLPAKKERKKRRASTYRRDPIETVLRDQITDRPAIEEKREKEEEINRIDISEEEIQQMLVGYSQRNTDDVAIREYFCYSSIPVFNKTGSRVSVNQFFNTIRDVKVELNSIKLIKDPKKGCIKSMTIDMRTKKGLFWKKF